MAIDPICGMTVDEATAPSAERDGQTFYFCCDHCRRKFLTDGQSASARHHDHHASNQPAPPKPRTESSKYFCPMCPGVEADKPGDCPVCGMALERNPAWRAAASSETVYTCPMHPEVRQQGPGDCPECGMALEPTVVTSGEDEPENDSGPRVPGDSRSGASPKRNHGTPMQRAPGEL